jgi:predicted DNA-binding protein
MEKTIAIRVPPSVHQTLVLLAKVAGTSLADQLREAIDEHIARKGSDVDLRELAQSELAQIDAESEDRKKAIQLLLRGSSTEQPAKGRPKGRSK